MYKDLQSDMPRYMNERKWVKDIRLNFVKEEVGER